MYIWWVRRQQHNGEDPCCFKYAITYRIFWKNKPSISFLIFENAKGTLKDGFIIKLSIQNKGIRCALKLYFFSVLWVLFFEFCNNSFVAPKMKTNRLFCSPRTCLWILLRLQPTPNYIRTAISKLTQSISGGENIISKIKSHQSLVYMFLWPLHHLIPWVLTSSQTDEWRERCSCNVKTGRD